MLQRFSLRALERASICATSALCGDGSAGFSSTIVDHQRRAIRRRRREVAMEQNDMESLAVEPDGELDGAVCNCLYKLLPTLKPDYADVIWRADILGEPRDRIAVSLGTTLNNVTVRIHRGRQALKKRLEEMCLTCPCTASWTAAAMRRNASASSVLRRCCEAQQDPMHILNDHRSGTWAIDDDDRAATRSNQYRRPGTGSCGGGIPIIPRRVQRPLLGRRRNRPRARPEMMNMMRMMGMMRPGIAGMIDRVEGRIAFLRTELKITEAQAGAWNAFAAALRTNAQKLGEVRAAMMPQPGAGQQQAAPTIAARLDLQERRLQARLEGTRAIKSAVTNLYATLSDDQKKTADELLAPHLGLGMMPMMSGQMQPDQMPTGQCRRPRNDE